VGSTLKKSSVKSNWGVEVTVGLFETAPQIQETLFWPIWIGEYMDFL